MIDLDPFKLTGKTFLVTGASSGIGRETCKRICQQGGSFIATARREELLKSLVEDCKKESNKFILADLSKDNDIEDLVTNTENIDGIIHCAGIVSLAPAKFYTNSMLNSMRAINYDSVIKIINLLIRNKKLNKESSIVLVSSISALYGMTGNGIYAGTKGALLSISKVWATEFAKSKIRVNCVSPGMVRTDITERSIEDLSLEVIQQDEKKYPLGYGNPTQVADPIVFLLSQASSWITGQNLILDGGRTACI